MKYNDVQYREAPANCFHFGFMENVWEIGRFDVIVGVSRQFV